LLESSVITASAWSISKRKSSSQPYTAWPSRRRRLRSLDRHALRCQCCGRVGAHVSGVRAYAEREN
jgi:hypothetical protein